VDAAAFSDSRSPADAPVSLPLSLLPLRPPPTVETLARHSPTSAVPVMSVSIPDAEDAAATSDSKSRPGAPVPPPPNLLPLPPPPTAETPAVPSLTNAVLVMTVSTLDVEDAAATTGSRSPPDAPAPPPPSPLPLRQTPTVETLAPQEPTSAVLVMSVSTLNAEDAAATTGSRRPPVPVDASLDPLLLLLPPTPTVETPAVNTPTSVVLVTTVSTLDAEDAVATTDSRSPPVALAPLPQRALPLLPETLTATPVAPAPTNVATVISVRTPTAWDVAATLAASPTRLHATAWLFPSPLSHLRVPPAELAVPTHTNAVPTKTVPTLTVVAAAVATDTALPVVLATVLRMSPDRPAPRPAVVLVPSTVVGLLDPTNHP